MKLVNKFSRFMKRYYESPRHATVSLDNRIIIIVFVVKILNYQIYF